MHYNELTIKSGLSAKYISYPDLQLSVDIKHAAVWFIWSLVGPINIFCMWQSWVHREICTCQANGLYGFNSIVQATVLLDAWYNWKRTKSFSDGMCGNSELEITTVASRGYKYHRPFIRRTLRERPLKWRRISMLVTVHVCVPLNPSLM